MALPKEELLERIRDAERRGDFHFVAEPIDENSYDPVDENYNHLCSGFLECLFHLFVRFIALIAGVFINGLAFGMKVNGRKNLRHVKSAVVTCNHVNNFDNLMVRNALFGHRLYIVVGEFNNKKGFFGRCLKAGGTLPLSANLRAMINLRKATEQLLKKRNYVLFYPEEAEWWMYEKPRPFRNGAFHFAATANVPVIPIFLTFSDPKGLRAKIIKSKVVTVHIMPPIYPKDHYSVKENVDFLRDANHELCVHKYEEVYLRPMVYDVVWPIDEAGQDQTAVP